MLNNLQQKILDAIWRTILGEFVLAAFILIVFPIFYLQHSNYILYLLYGLAASYACGGIGLGLYESLNRRILAHIQNKRRIDFEKKIDALRREQR